LVFAFFSFLLVFVVGFCWILLVFLYQSFFCSRPVFVGFCLFLSGFLAKLAHLKNIWRN